MAIHIFIHGIRDAGFNESDHPRAANGQFGSGSGGSAEGHKGWDRHEELTKHIHKQEHLEGVRGALGEKLGEILKKSAESGKTPTPSQISDKYGIPIGKAKALSESIKEFNGMHAGSGRAMSQSERVARHLKENNIRR